MNKDNLHNRTATFLLSVGLVLSQLPPAFAQTVNDGTGTADAQIAQASGITPMPAAPSVKINATAGDSSVLRGNVTSNVENVSRDILHDEISLQRFNLNFRVNAAKQGRWKGWRFFFGQEGNLICTGTGLIVYEADSLSHVKHGAANINRQSKNIRANGGGVPGLVGAGLGIEADAVELALNWGHQQAANRKGYGFVQSRETALKLVNDIDKKLAQREALIKEQPASEKEIAEMQELEGKVLGDFRDMAVAEFERYHVGARKTLAQQNSFYLLDAMFNKTPGAIGTAFGMHDILGNLKTRGARPGFDIPTGVMGIVTGTFIAANPLLSRMYGKIIEKRTKASLEHHGLPTVWENADKLEADWTRLESFCKNHQVHDRPELNLLVSRLAAYDANHKFVTDELQRNARALRRGNRTAVQNMGMGSLVGASKIAQGIIQVNCGANYFHDNIRRFTLFTTASLQYLPVIWLAAADNVRIQYGNEKRRRDLAAKHVLPGQLIKARMEELKVIETRI